MLFVASLAAPRFRQLLAFAALHLAASTVSLCTGADDASEAPIRVITFVALSVAGIVVAYAGERLRREAWLSAKNVAFSHEEAVRAGEPALMLYLPCVEYSLC